MVPLPNLECVRDYFSWRQEDAHRNSLNAHCYWLLRREGMSPREATREIEGRTVAFKNELLFSRNINFNDLPNWQKRGVGLYYSSYEKKGYNPVKDETVTSIRSRLDVNMDLEIGQAYTDWVISLIPED